MGLSTSGSKARPVAVLTLLGLAFAVVVRVLSSTTLARADFVFNNGAEVQSLDPATVTGVPEGRILRGILEGLCVKDPFTLEPIPRRCKVLGLEQGSAHLHLSHSRRSAVVQRRPGDCARL